MESTFVSEAVPFVVKMNAPELPKRNRQNNHAEPGQVRKARSFIEEHSGEMLSLETIATAASISPNYLSEKFKAVTGENVVRYIARTRVEHACELLHNGELRISEIAFAVGFQSLSQFNRIFKRLLDRSPTQFRRAVLETNHQKQSARAETSGAP